MWCARSRADAVSRLTENVARAAGLAGRARQAGTALRLAPRELNLPWASRGGRPVGRIVFPPASREYREQARRLRAEGVTVRDGRSRVPP